MWKTIVLGSKMLNIWAIGVFTETLSSIGGINNKKT